MTKRNLWVVSAINNRNSEPVVLTVVSSRERARKEARRVSPDNYNDIRITRSRRIGAGIVVE